LHADKAYDQPALHTEIRRRGMVSDQMIIW
jgi:hypothetical protein